MKSNKLNLVAFIVKIILNDELFSSFKKNMYVYK